MTKTQKTLLSVLMFVLALCMGVLFAACTQASYTVTFNIEGKTQTAEVVDGKVSSMPTDPEKDYYTFMGWYTTSDFQEGTEFTADTKVSGNITVYAYFAPKKVSVSVNGGTAESINLENLTAKTTAYTADATSQNLTFDGWYVDSAYTTKYTSESQSADNLYARYMATVTFDNGYETVTKLVSPNGSLAKPEVSEIKKDYMSSEDISYVWADTKTEVTFPATIANNVEITVLWKSEGLKFVTNSHTNNLICTGFDENSGINYKNLQVISVPAKVGGKTVEAVYGMYVSSLNMPSVRKVIFQEGIKSISGFHGLNTSGVESVVLPSSLRIIDRSFNGFPNLKQESFSIPEKTEVIIDSFFKHKSVTDTDADSGCYDFEIAVPDSVINLSNVPTNLVFGENSVFKKDADGNIYTDSNSNGKLLVAVSKIENGAITVSEDYVGIQVGTFFAFDDLKYLTLPSTWQYVAYNVAYESTDGDGVARTYFNASDSRINLSRADMSNPLNDLGVGAYAILESMDSVERVRINQTTYPENVEAFALVGNTAEENQSDYFQPYLASAFKNKVFFMEDLEPGTSVTVSIAATNKATEEKLNISLDGVVSGDTLTTEKIAKAIGDKLNVDFDKVFVFTYVRESGVDLGDGYFVTRNVDITAEFEYGPFGFTTADDGNGGLAVSAYDADGVYVNGTEKIVNIPDEIDGKKVTKINSAVFKGTDITTVYIGKNVAEIGSEAFMNTTSLATVKISVGSLSVIGRSAFENSGFTSIALPVSTLTDVQPYAFKSEKLQKFVSAGDNISSMLGIEKVPNWQMDSAYSQFSSDFFTLNEINVGNYFFIADFSGNNIMLAKYTGSAGTEKQATASATTEKTVDVSVYDVEIVATAGGATIKSLSLGYSSRGIYFGAETGFVLRFSFAEGSVYYLKSLTEIVFGYVKTIAKNAFTDMGSVKAVVFAGNYNAASTYPADCYDEWMTLEQITTMDSTIFADGWWNGVLKSDADYSEKMAFMTNAAKSKVSGVFMISHS